MKEWYFAYRVLLCLPSEDNFLFSRVRDKKAVNLGSVLSCEWAKLGNAGDALASTMRRGAASSL